MPIQVSNFYRPLPNILERLVLAAPRQKRCAGTLLPLYEADIARETYKVAIFDEHSLKVEDFARPYGAEAYRTDVVPTQSVEIKMSRYTVEASVDKAETEGSNNIIQASLLMREERLRHSYNKLMNSIEAMQVSEILQKGSYQTHVFTPKAGTFWNEDASQPIQDILVAKDIIKKKIGFNPNTMVISESVWKALRNKKDLLTLLPNTTLRSGLTPEDFASIIGIEEVIIADGMIHNGKELVYAWGNNAVLAYVPKTLFTLDEPSFGITVRAPLGYHSMREYFDDRTTSDITSIDEKLGWKVSNYQAGFLFSDLISV
ncbi:MAG: hypothetical protein ACRCTQ_05185 [Brevinemataceae bacterium]